jgi:hypothetical protein
MVSPLIAFVNDAAGAVGGEQTHGGHGYDVLVISGVGEERAELFAELPVTDHQRDLGLALDFLGAAANIVPISARAMTRERILKVFLLIAFPPYYK